MSEVKVGKHPKTKTKEGIENYHLLGYALITVWFTGLPEGAGPSKSQAVEPPKAKN